MLDSLAPARRRLVLLALAAAAVAALAGGVVLLRTTGEAVEPVPQDQPGPVLLVSGYGGSTAALEPLRRVLEDQGRVVVVVRPLGEGTGDLGEQAAALADVAQRTLDDLDAPSVDVVGYSAGGVVARLWVRDHGGASLARRVLTVGSPHHGTDVAALAVNAGCPAACEQLVPDSRLLRRLNAGDETPPGPVFASIWTTADRTVTPPSSADLDGALAFTVQSVCPGTRTSHGGLPADAVVLAALRTILGAPPPRPPAPDVCVP